MMEFLRLTCQYLGALLLLSWAVVIAALVLAKLTARVERTRERRALSVCLSCGEPQQGGWCQNCSPVIRAERPPVPCDAEVVERFLASLERR